MINNIQGTQILSLKPNWENHQHFLLLQNYIYNGVCKLSLAGDKNPQVSQLQLKDATTPWFFPAPTNKDATTPYLPATIGRRLRPPGLLAIAERML